MGTFLIYLLKSSICLTILYICIKAFLSKETFHRFNRRAILIGAAVCMLLPLIKITTPEYSVIQKPILLIEEAFIQDNISIEDPIIQKEITINKETSSTEKKDIDTETIILIIYITGISINLIFLLRSIYSMCHLIHSSSKLRKGSYIFVTVSKDINPFSWAKYIVLSKMDYSNNPTEIITHEIAHIKHRHSVDLIYMELIILFQWFNPAVWLLKRELKDIHEYQADISVLQSDTMEKSILTKVK